jgi:hypothetical protein
MPRRLLALAALVACGGSPPTVTPPVVPAPPASTASAAPAAPAPVEAPKGLALWSHVEQPSTLVTAVRPMLDADTLALLDAIDLTHPIDIAAWASPDKDGVAAAFTVKSRDAVEGDLGRVSDAKRSIKCEFAPGSGDVAVCGDDHGLTHLAPWLRSAPKPPAGALDEAVHVEVYAPPVLARAGVGKNATGELALLAHDWTGASLGVRLAGDSVAFKLDLRLGSATSGWTKALLADTSPGPMPDSFGRMPDGANMALGSPGGAVLGALLNKGVDLLGFLGKPEVLHAVAADVDATVLSKPWLSVSYIDPDEAHAALARLRKTPNDPRAAQAVKDAFDGYTVGVGSTDAKGLETLVNDLGKAFPPDKSVAGTKLSMSTAPASAALGLPKGSVVVTYKTTSAPAKRKAPPPKPKIEQTLFVPDGATFWSIGGTDLAREARLLKRLLAAPAHAPAAPPPGAFLVGSFGSKLGAYWADLEGFDLGKGDARLAAADTLQKTLDEPPSSIPFALASKKDDAGGGTVTITVSGNPATMKKVGGNLALPIMGMAIGIGMLGAISGMD